MTEISPELLQELIADDKHGLLTPEVKPEPVTNADILANRFEEINTFIDRHGRNPDSENRDDIGEFQLGHRLQTVLENPEYRTALQHLDRHDLFAESALPTSIEDVLRDGALLDGLGDSSSSLFERKHLPPPERVMPDKIAQGKPCEDFKRFEPLFVACHADLRSGRRSLVPFQKPSNIKKDGLYVQRGMLVLVAEVGELEQGPDGKNGRLRCIFENGTESDLLLRSFSRNLYDEGKIVTEPNDTYTETFLTPDHVPTGHVYVARTRSTEQSLKGFSNLHKIGYTSQTPTARVASAESQSTFFYSGADLVDSYEMPDEYAKLLENILHQFFSEVRVDARFEGGPAATEWFDVPSQAITEAIELVQAGQLTNYRYNPSTQEIVIA